jgi:hypothetical protein
MRWNDKTGQQSFCGRYSGSAYIILRKNADLKFETYITDAAGKTTYYDTKGDFFDPTGPDVIPPSDPGYDLSGGDTSWIDDTDWSLF